MSHLHRRFPHDPLSTPNTGEVVVDEPAAAGGAFLPTTASAQTGSITGTVTNSVTGAPIAGVPIFIIRTDNLSESGVAGAAMTNASGIYTFNGPAVSGTTWRPSLRTKVWISSTRYSEASGLRSTSPISQNGTPVTIPPGGTRPRTSHSFRADMSGTVTDAATGAPLANVLSVRVSLWQQLRLLADRCDDRCRGRYDIGGLAPGQIFLITRSFNVPGYVDESWDEQPVRRRVRGIERAGAGADADHDPVRRHGCRKRLCAGSRRRRFGPDHQRRRRADPEPRCEHQRARERHAAVPGSVSTNADGVYRFSGGYGNLLRLHRSRQLRLHERALRQHPAPARVQQRAERHRIPVTVRNTTGNRDFQLDNLSGVIAGTVTRANGRRHPERLASLRLHGSAPASSPGPPTPTPAASTASPVLPPAPTGLYTSNTSSWVNEIFNDIPCVGGGCNDTAAAALGTPIAVGRGATVSNQNFALVDGAFISGVVRDSVSLTPIAGQTVQLSMQSGSGATFVTSRQSGNDGYFSFAGLTAGTYSLNTSGQNGYQNELQQHPVRSVGVHQLRVGDTDPLGPWCPLQHRQLQPRPDCGRARARSQLGDRASPGGHQRQPVPAGRFRRLRRQHGHELPRQLLLRLAAGRNLRGVHEQLTRLPQRDLQRHPVHRSVLAATAASNGAAINVTSTAWTSGIDPLSTLGRAPQRHRRTSAWS